MSDLKHWIGKTSTGGLGPTVDYEDRNFLMNVFQTGNAAINTDFNLVQEMVNFRLRRLIKDMTDSGFIRPEGLVFIQPAANQFELPACEAYVNGWWMYVANPIRDNEKVLVQLSAPTDRDDLVFLEVFLREIAPTGSAETDDEDVKHYGGVDNPDQTNDILIATAPIKETTRESTRRVQIRWQIRVVDGVDFGAHPTGMTDPSVLAQGGQSAPVAGYTFSLLTGDDDTLWRAGAGSETSGEDLGVVDGFTYAIPIARVTRTTGVTDIEEAETSDLRPSAVVGAPEQTISIPLTINGSDDADVITIGKKVRLTVDYPVDLDSWSLLADAPGNITIDVHKGTYDDFPTTASICAAARPTLSAAQKNTDDVLTGWTTRINAGEIIEVQVDAVDDLLRNVTLTLKGRRAQ